jgi:phosphopantothenoylcysteine decarboxylase/phosphopantothenate--cysteine ligase
MPSDRTIVLGVTGSIAAVKAPEIVRLLRDKNYTVRCVMTKSAAQFTTPLVLSTFSGSPVISDFFGAEAYTMPHLSLASDADLLIVAPLSTTVLARMAQGLAEDMISLTYITTTAPTLVAPAMHNTMWEHPATQANARLLRERGVQFVGPNQGPLADKTRGDGRMAEPEDIVKAAEAILNKKKK